MINPTFMCKERFPLCGAPYELTVPNHKSQHYTKYHMYSGLKGWTKGKNTFFLNERICNGYVADREWRVIACEGVAHSFYYQDYRRYFPN